MKKAKRSTTPMSVMEAVEALTSMETFKLIVAANANLKFEKIGCPDEEKYRVFWNELMKEKKENPGIEFALPELDITISDTEKLVDWENFD